MALFQQAQQNLAERARQRQENYDRAVKEAQRKDAAFAKAERTVRVLAISAARGERLSEYAAAKKRHEELCRKKHLLPPQPACPRCGDTGFSEGVPCTCLRQEICSLLESSLLSAWEPVTADQVDFGKFSPAQADALKKRYAQADRIAKNPIRLTPCLLTYCGKTGTGKSFLAKYLAASLRRNGYTTLFLSSYALFDLLSKLYQSEDRSLITSVLSGCDALIVDDLGTEACAPSARNIFTSLLSVRAERKKLTVLTTNLYPDELKEVYGERIFSRLADRTLSRLYRFDGQDARLQTPETSQQQNK